MKFSSLSFSRSSHLCFATSRKGTEWESNTGGMPPQTGDREREPWGAATMELAETNPGVCAPLPPPLCTHSPCETIWCMYCCSHLSITTGGGAAASYKATLTVHARAGIKKDMQKGSWSSRGTRRVWKSFEGFMCRLIWTAECQRLVSVRL